MRWAARLFGFICVLVIGLISIAYISFGGGSVYPDLSGAPELPNGTIEAVVVSEQPIGNATVSADGRIFYTIHPESHPAGPKLYEWVDDTPIPYPDRDTQDELFISPLGVAIDQQNRLWIIDPANHGFSRAVLTAIDLATGSVVHRHTFDRKIAPIGSFLQDLQISSDGRWVYIADVGFWAKRPGFVIYDTQKETARRLLSRHESVYPQNLLIRNQIKDMSFFGGLVEMKTGLDGIALSRDDQWIYYGAMNHDTLYRIPAAALQDEEMSETDLIASIEAVGKKPLNDGFSIDSENNVFITDIEHQAVLRMGPNGALTTMVKDDRIRWADGLSFGPDGWLYLADSSIPDLALQSEAHRNSAAPYYVWRFQPGTSGPAGQ